MKYSEEQLKKYETYRHDLIDQIAESLSSTTVQFFYENKKGLPEATGSGLFFEVENRHFVITAAHVIAEHPNDTYIIVGTEGIILGGLLHFVALHNSEKRKDDKIDLAFIELDNSLINLIKSQYRFLTLDDIQVDHSINESFQYLSYGYPVTKTKFKNIQGERVIVTSPFIYNSTILPNFNHARFGFRQDVHIAIKFSGEIKSNVNKLPHLAPDVSGISGSGLWYLLNFPFPEVLENRKLVGIVIERVKELDNKAIVAVSIDLIIEFFRNNLGISTLPKSQKINVRSNIV
jgi:hypothetical protein